METTHRLGKIGCEVGRIGYWLTWVHRVDIDWTHIEVKVWFESFQEYPDHASNGSHRYSGLEGHRNPWGPFSGRQKMFFFSETDESNTALSVQHDTEWDS